MAILRFLGYMVLYVFLALAFLASGLGFTYIGFAIGSVFGNQYCVSQWHSLDILICSLVQGTRRRTISGWSGQYSSHAKRYYYSEKLINWLAERFGDDPDHCYRAYQWEKEKGLV